MNKRIRKKNKYINMDKDLLKKVFLEKVYGTYARNNPYICTDQGCKKVVHYEMMNKSNLEVYSHLLTMKVVNASKHP